MLHRTCCTAAERCGDDSLIRCFDSAYKHGMRIVAVLLLLLASPLQARPFVVEFFTSQGCAACPPADAIVGEFVNRPDLLPLAYHVDYWDYMGYKDPFALAQSERRQKQYNMRFGIDSLFTPQVVVDGLATAIGSHRKAIDKILRRAMEDKPDIPISMTRDPEKNEMIVKVSGLDDGLAVGGFPNHADIWMVTFLKGYRTPVDGGENVGKDLANFNIVRQLVLLGKWSQRTEFHRIPLDNFTEDALTILVQEEDGGRILGATVFYQR